MADADERTEAPTAKRRGDARAEGEVAQSKDLASVALLAATIVLLGSSLAAAVVESVIGQMQMLLSGQQVRPETLADFHAILLYHGGVTVRALAPFILVLAAVGILVHQVQTGPLYAAKATAFKATRLDPLKGMKRFVSVNSVVELLKSVIKVTVTLWFAWGFVEGQIATLLQLSGAPVTASFALAIHLVQELAKRVLAVLALFAVLDVVWVRFRFEKNLRMTKQEVREEMLQREGSPQIRARRRQKQIEMSQMRMIANVAKADVVITNPTHFAVALRYERRAMRAPTVVAKGRNHLALRIRETAKKHDVPIVENKPLAQLLYKTARLDREIPDALYQAVAEVLAMVARLAPHRALAWRSAS